MIECHEEIDPINPIELEAKEDTKTKNPKKYIYDYFRLLDKIPILLADIEKLQWYIEGMEKIKKTMIHLYRCHSKEIVV